MTDSRSDSAQLLHSLGYLYTECGLTQRGIFMLLTAAKIEPDNIAILKTLANAYLRDHAAEDALSLIDKIEYVDGTSPVLTLLRSKALWMRGDRDDARRTFRDFIDMRSKVSK